MKLLSFALFAIFAASIIIAIGCLFKKTLHDKAACYLWWLFFPIEFPYWAKSRGVIKKKWKRIVLLFLCPWFFCSYLVIALSILVVLSFEGDYGTPQETHYHTARDLEMVTGVAFPDVIPVDSIYYDSWSNNYIKVWMVPKQPLSEKFFKNLDKACKEDSCCWRKDSLGYTYLIDPEKPLGRTNGSHWRSVGMDGQQISERCGSYVKVWVPLTGDTIKIEDGWYGE